ncbi:MAG: D-alanyl-D-alanine carboxypeptidase, partial [Acidobacteriota bacterium]|nr:D-alanyl-D-alanine carboxypeptidase [Acidobacteriota bacterium]
MSRPRRPALRGLATRALGALIGAALAGAIVVAMQVPLLHQRARATLTLAHLPTVGATPALAWPPAGSAAVLIPGDGVAVASSDAVLPVASLTKMMTAYVALQRLPLAGDAAGPCVTVTASDVADYRHDVATGQSTALVSAGEVLCEHDLLAGLLVHSANDYAMILARLASGSVGDLVAQMNDAARRLGLRHTHYVEPSGYDPGSVSTAMEQGRLAVDLMASPLARALVRQTSVTLPVAGTLTTFTPDVGVDNVIGVKSGRTEAAGGCDVMAMTYPQGPATKVIYSVVLGQRGGDLLGPAGAAALALAQSARANLVHLVFARGTPVGRVGWAGSSTPVTLRASHDVWWWAPGGPPAVSIHVGAITSRVRSGQVV